MSSKHTPGPWTAAEQDRVLTGPHREEYACRFVLAQQQEDDENGILIAYLDQDDTGPSTEANALLVAAAPDLLAACEASSAVVEHEADCEAFVAGRACEVCGRLRYRAAELRGAALAKARGDGHG